MTVEDWGIGKPDFVEITSPTRTEVQSDSQTAWSVTFDDLAVAPITTVSATVYDVPENQKLVLGYIKGTTNIDCIIRSAILKNGVATCPLRFSQYSVVALTDLAAFVFDAGDRLGYTITNPLTDSCIVVSGDVSGFLYDV